MPIDCILCIRDEDGRYYTNLYVTILSIFKNTNVAVRIHVLHDETIHHAVDDLKKLCEEYGQEIQFHQVPEVNPRFKIALNKRFNIAATYRYYAHELIDSPKAIYLDCDLVVNLDIKELYEIDLGNHLIAATLDNSSHWKNGRVRSKVRKKVNYLGLTPETCFCSGVMLMNLDRIREISQDMNIFWEKTAKAVKDGIWLDYPDQDILNSIAGNIPDGYLKIDERFNFWGKMLHMSIEELNDKIVHFVSHPDKGFFPAHLLFWKYYAMTPFAWDMIERMDASYSRPAMRFVKYYAQNTKYRRQGEDLLECGILGMLGRAVGRKLGIKKLK